jgi:toxin-antitoxin system PIN domain toxin
MLLDANILLYAVDETSSFHERCRSWLVEALNGPQRVGIPWQSLSAFLRIVTNARTLANPLSGPQAWAIAEAWLAAPATWVPLPGRRHQEILGRLVVTNDLRGNLISDAVLAALCIEHGLAIVSADSDFARFPELQWVNPTATG